MKFIKTILGGILVVGLMSIAVEQVFNSDVVIEKDIVEEEIVIEVPAIEEESAVEKAQAQLDLANTILDAEESKILEEIAKYQSWEAEAEAKLEQIRETRTSF